MAASHVMPIGVGCSGCRALWDELKAARKELARLKGEAMPEQTVFVGWARPSSRGRWFIVEETRTAGESECLMRLLDFQGRGMDVTVQREGCDPNEKKAA
jgi:hypothetical protein